MKMGMHCICLAPTFFPPNLEQVDLDFKYGRYTEGEALPFEAGFT